HGIPAQHVLQGALVLCNTLPYMPQGVHLAVVDPGVGGHRRPLAIRTGEGRFLVGPDNGLLLPAADRLGSVEAAHELANPEYALDTVPPKFHGRDRFPPAADPPAPGGSAARAFADAGPADIILYEDAYKNAAIAISGGSAAEMFGVGAGQEVRIHLRTP